MAPVWMASVPPVAAATFCHFGMIPGVLLAHHSGLYFRRTYGAFKHGAAAGHSVWWVRFSGVELPRPHRTASPCSLFGQRALKT